MWKLLRGICRGVSGVAGVSGMWKSLSSVLVVGLLLGVAEKSTRA